MTATVVLVLRILLAIVLYIFLWRVFQALWQELKQQGTLLSSQKKPNIHVDARMEDGKEYKYHFWQNEFVIGRASHCDISLTDEALSASHARVSHHHGHWWLEDLGSTNGTFINQEQVTVPTVIITGDRFQCGNTNFSLRIDLLDDKFSSNTQDEIGGPT
ncbi:MAG TPA: FHA domain-containing protein [Anaerolineales bacterium]